MRSVRVVVRGRVQGVGFRWFARDAAEQHGVTGWVRNRADGTVEAELHGRANAVHAVLDLLRSGPPHARVDDVAATAIPSSSDADDPRRSGGFEIRPTTPR